MAEELWNTVLKEIGEHLGESAGILLVIISAAYLSSIFTATADLESSGNHDVVSFAVICLISVPVIANIGEVVAQAGDTISEIRTVMLSSIPGLCAMDMGSSAAGAAVFITITQLAAILLSKIFLPAAVVYAAVGICGSVTERFSLEGVKGMVRFLFTWGLGIMMIGFSCAATLSGAGESAQNTIEKIRVPEIVIDLNGIRVEDANENASEQDAAQKEMERQAAAVIAELTGAEESHINVKWSDAT